MEPTERTHLAWLLPTANAKCYQCLAERLDRPSELGCPGFREPHTSRGDNPKNRDWLSASLVSLTDFLLSTAHRPRVDGPSDPVTLAPTYSPALISSRGPSSACSRGWSIFVYSGHVSLGAMIDGKRADRPSVRSLIGWPSRVPGLAFYF